MYRSKRSCDAPAALSLPFSRRSGQPYDLVIRNGRVVDGTGKAWYYADVAVQGGKIARIGSIPATDRKRVIAPGFVDVHTHSESSIDERPGAENFLYDGVTTLPKRLDGPPPSLLFSRHDYPKPRSPRTTYLARTRL